MKRMNIEIEVRGCSYYLERVGKGESLVLLHGFAGSVGTWKTLQDKLAEQYDVIAIDILGHGRTACPLEASRYTMKEISLDLNEIFQKLELKGFHLLGYSMGGRLALYFAYHYPDKIGQLFLESSSPGLKTVEERHQRQEKDNQLAQRILSNGIEWFVDYWLTLPIFQVKQDSQEIHQGLSKLHHLQKDANPIGLANSLKGMGTGAQDSLWPVLKEISCKTTLICGANDEKFCTINKEMQAILPNAKQIIFEGAGHRVHLECPNAFVQALMNELNEK